MPAEIRLLMIMRVRRSKRSTTEAAIGIKKNDGVVLHKITTLAPRPLFVNCRAKPSTATLLNQSPAAEISWAAHRCRKRLLLRSSVMYPTVVPDARAIIHSRFLIPVDRDFRGKG